MLWKAHSFITLAQSLNVNSYMPHFGVGPHVIAIIWTKITKPDGAKPHNLLWILMFLIVYASEEVFSNLIQVCRNTYRKWVWSMLIAI
jgi:hypothetical protein